MLRCNCRGCDCYLAVFDHNNFGGRALIIKQQNANFGNDFFHDRVESALVQGSCRWILYEHGDFVGQSHLINGDSIYLSPPSWGGSGNRISSARALPPAGTDAILLFEHGHFEGRMLRLYNSDSDLSAMEFDNHLSSFIITSGRWTLYEHPGFGGHSTTYGPGEYAIPPPGIGHDRISSVKKL